MSAGCLVAAIALPVVYLLVAYCMQRSGLQLVGISIRPVPVTVLFLAISAIVTYRLTRARNR